MAVKAYQSMAFVIRKGWAASLHLVSEHPHVLIVIPVLPALLSLKSSLASGKLVVWVFQGNWVYVEVGGVSSLVDKEPKEPDKS